MSKEITENKDNRNSRQIILWGTHGQESVNNARLVMLGSDCCASEVLKNLILHGIGHTLIIDDAVVAKDDLQSNFFVDAAHEGKSRAETVAALLQELNPSVKVEGRNKSPYDLSFISENPKPNFVGTCGNLKVSFLEELNKLCRQNKICQAHIQTTGFFGAFYIDAGLHHVFENLLLTKYPIEELRTLNPFPELLEFFHSIDFENCSDNEYAHIPSMAMFYRAAELASQELNIPIDKLQKTQIVAKLEKLWRRNISDKCYLEAVEFASRYMLRVNPFNLTTAGLFKVFNLSDQLGEIDQPFWHLVRATQRFYKKYGVLPHYGGLPDITTSSENYNKLRKIYSKKHEDDWNEIHEDLKSRGVTIDDSTFGRFSKNVWRIFAIDYKPIVESLNLKPTGAESSPFQKNISIIQSIFIALRNFYEKNNRQPGNTQEDRDAIMQEVKSLNVKLDEADLPKYIQEFLHYKGTLIPSVTATLSGILAEEITKIIIHQCTPVDGVFIYDALAGFGEKRPIL